MSVLAAANGYDLGVALVVGIPSTIAAFVAALAWRDARKAKHSAQRTEVETKSPNGESTANAVYEIRKAVVGLTAAAGELKAGQQTMQRQQAEHLLADEVRFGRVFAHLDLDVT